MVASSLRHPIKLGDVTYDVSPLDDDGHNALDAWVRAKYIERSAPMIEALASDADKRLALSVAYKDSLSLTWMSSEGARMMGTIEGVARLLYEGIRKNHPSVTFEEIKSRLRDSRDIANATQAFEIVNEVLPGKDPPKKAQRTRRSRSPKKKRT